MHSFHGDSYECQDTFGKSHSASRTIMAEKNISQVFHIVPFGASYFRLFMLAVLITLVVLKIVNVD